MLRGGELAHPSPVAGGLSEKEMVGQRVHMW
jgi:hypothetical protein